MIQARCDANLPRCFGSQCAENASDITELIRERFGESRVLTDQEQFLLPRAIVHHSLPLRNGLRTRGAVDFLSFFEFLQFEVRRLAHAGISAVASGRTLPK